MSKITIEQHQQKLQSEVTEVTQDISIIKACISRLEEEYSHSSFIAQTVGNWFGFGPSNKLQWQYFKLKLKQRDLTQMQTSLNKYKAA